MSKSPASVFLTAFFASALLVSAALLLLQATVKWGAPDIEGEGPVTPRAGSGSLSTRVTSAVPPRQEPEKPSLSPIAPPSAMAAEPDLTGAVPVEPEAVASPSAGNEIAMPSSGDGTVAALSDTGPSIAAEPEDEPVSMDASPDPTPVSTLVSESPPDKPAPDQVADETVSLLTVDSPLDEAEQAEEAEEAEEEIASREEAPATVNASPDLTPESMLVSESPPGKPAPDQVADETVSPLTVDSPLDEAEQAEEAEEAEEEIASREDAPVTVNAAPGLTPESTLVSEPPPGKPVPDQAVDETVAPLTEDSASDEAEQAEEEIASREESPLEPVSEGVSAAQDAQNAGPAVPFPQRRPAYSVASVSEPAARSGQREHALPPRKPRWKAMTLAPNELAAKPPQQAKRPNALAAKPPQKVKRPATTSYNAKIWSALARHKPRAGRRGSTSVTFGIGTMGALRFVRVSRSSGDPKLDRLALATVRSAAPFPSPPGGARSFTIRIHFR